ncbi:MAG TPA: hypothetical protein ENF65_01445 [Euryarchaeota archaeon]|nr:MAG: hypothetical protein DRN52_01570 [Thermococci archaeon]HDI10391.1 hypothetical protein [Euryarchaeota archaeon]
MRRFDLAVLLILVIVSLPTGLKFVTQSEYVFEYRIYDAVKKAIELNQEGKLIHLEIEGYYTRSKQKGKLEGYFLDGISGRLRVLTENETVVSIGGQYAYIEDFASIKIKMRALDKEEEIFILKNVENPTELLEKVKEIREEEKCDLIYVEGVIGFEKESSPSEIAELNSKVSWSEGGLGLSLVLYPNGILATLEKTSIKGLEFLSGLSYDRVHVGRCRVHCVKVM